MPPFRASTAHLGLALLAQASTTAFLWRGGGPRSRLLLSVQGLASAGSAAASWLSANEWREPPPVTRASAPAPTVACRGGPAISVHVPVGHEPLLLVANCLSDLEACLGPDDEVVVVVNNYPGAEYEEAVRVLAGRLGRRSRVIARQRLRGGKPAALNLALAATDPRAGVVAVIDADYRVARGFLEQTRAVLATGTDDAVQFRPRFVRAAGGVGAAAWLDQQWFLDRHLPARCARGDLPMLGSLFAVRKDVLVGVGGWDETALTEDSELGLRLWSAGKRVQYMDVDVGSGTVPSTFGALTRQRRRWTYGPVQQLLRLAGRPRRQALRSGPVSGYAQCAGNALFGVQEAAAVTAALVAPRRRGNHPAGILLAAPAVALWALDRGARLRLLTAAGASSLQAAQALSLDAALRPTRAAAAIRALLGAPLVWEVTPKAAMAAPQSRREALSALALAAELALLAWATQHTGPEGRLMLVPLAQATLTRCHTVAWQSADGRRRPEPQAHAADAEGPGRGGVGCI